MCALLPRRRRCGFDGLAAAARGARGQRVRLSGLAPQVTAASALARMTAKNNLRHGYRTFKRSVKATGAASAVSMPRADEWCLLLVSYCR